MDSRRLPYWIFERDNFTCQYCGRSSIKDKVRLHADHIKPRIKKGKDKAWNIITSCQECNLSKGSTDLSEEVVKRLTKHTKEFDNPTITFSERISGKTKIDFSGEEITLRQLQLGAKQIREHFKETPCPSLKVNARNNRFQFYIVGEKYFEALLEAAKPELTKLYLDEAKKKWPDFGFIQEQPEPKKPVNNERLDKFIDAMSFKFNLDIGPKKVVVDEFSEVSYDTDGNQDL